MPEVKIKNRDIEPTGLQFSLLIQEKITFGTKNRIQKILKQITEHWEPFHKIHIELIKSFGGTEKEGGGYSLPDPKNKPEGFQEQYDEVGDQEVTLNVDLIDYSKLDMIETDKVYDFELLEPFFEK